MMSPTMVFNNGSPSIVLGSAGSNRLRTAILQTIIRLIDARQDMHKAVNGPRIHWERGHLDVEPGFNRRILQRLRQRAPSITEWAKNNLFFGGLHAVAYHNSKFCGAGDQRRGGVFRTT